MITVLAWSEVCVSDVCIGYERQCWRGSGRDYAEELALSCAAKIISVASNADPVIRQQAEAFKSTIEQVVLMYLKQTAKSERTTIYNLVLDAGEMALAEQIRRL